MNEVREVHVDWLFERPGVSPPLAGAVLGIEDGKIAEVRPAPQRPGARRIALPGLVNAHDHGRCIRPLAYGASDGALECWLATLTHAPDLDLYTQCAVAFGRMALSGIAAAAHVHIPAGGDPVEEARIVARAAADIGIRIGFAAPISDTNGLVYGGPERIRHHYDDDEWEVVRRLDGRPLGAAEQIAAVAEMAAACDGPLFTVQHGPVGPQWVTEGGLRLLAEHASADGCRMHMHLLESRAQREWSDRHYPGGLLTFLDELGLLSPRLTVAHFVWPTDAEIALAAERGVSVSVNSSSNLRLRSGIAPVVKFLEHGVRFACGLDNMAFNDDEDELFELRLLAGLHARRGVHGPGLSLSEAWTAATANGRRTIDGSEGYGVLEPGADADFMVLDLEAIAPEAIMELVDPLDAVMTRAWKRHLTDLYVAGRHVVAEGRLAGFDLDAAEAEVAKAIHASAPRLIAERPTVRRHRGIVEGYYRDGGHLERRDDGGPEDACP